MPKVFFFALGSIMAHLVVQERFGQEDRCPSAHFPYLCPPGLPVGRLLITLIFGQQTQNKDDKNGLEMSPSAIDGPVELTWSNFMGRKSWLYETIPGMVFRHDLELGSNGLPSMADDKIDMQFIPFFSYI